MPDRFFLYLLVMAGVTYLIRMLPLTLFRKPIRNRYVRAFLAYIPYAVLAAMTIPDIFFAAASPLAAAVGFAVACLLAFFEKKLLTVACAACAAVFAVERLMEIFANI